MLVLASSKDLHFLNAILMAVICCRLCSTSMQMTWSKYFIYWCVQTLIEGLFLQMAPQNVRNTQNRASKQTFWFTPWYEVSPVALQELGSSWCCNVLVFIRRKNPSRRARPNFVIISMLLLRCLPARFCLDQIFNWCLKTLGSGRVQREAGEEVFYSRNTDLYFTKSAHMLVS